MTPDDSSSIFLEEDIVNMINEANLIVRQTNIVTKHIRMKFKRVSIAPNTHINIEESEDLFNEVYHTFTNSEMTIIHRPVIYCNDVELIEKIAKKRK